MHVGLLRASRILMPFFSAEDGSAHIKDVKDLALRVGAQPKQLSAEREREEGTEAGEEKLYAWRGSCGREQVKERERA